ncbi:transmembrane protein, putative (macronuclear) [Tetrahymena thermophila SB210]|uniref:Transmembrane protein, putative n=1 Tax=Tetrahymena thermophila (strain SB210) TaxID=312017 RepID=Q22AE6_TETTS|nr:transmembrane protein, putative [Tetrahymena thermophila SB210]EAR82270.3 transmembrane protein, putative [Tetrahymena thermophila SB210]|eukprot:XP_001029933.3 transmembrane protein, putative [Tetrahymena thermophila SB210]
MQQIVDNNINTAVIFLTNPDCPSFNIFQIYCGTIVLFNYGDLFDVSYFNQYHVFSSRDDCIQNKTISQIVDITNEGELTQVTQDKQMNYIELMNSNCYDQNRYCQPNVNCVKCSQGFCLQQINSIQNNCYDITSLSNFIGVTATNFCQYYQQININCYSQIDGVCQYQLNQNQKMCTLMTQDPNIIGKTINNNCYFNGYTAEQLKYCAPKYCILFDINGYSCQNIDLSTFIVGLDPNLNCLLPNQNNAYKCRYGYCIIQNSQGYFCVQLNPNIEQQMAKNINNDFCQSIQQQTGNSVNCAYSYCLDQNQNCVPLSNQDGYRGKIFFTDRCSDYGGSETLIQCMKSFCIYNNQCVAISGIYLGKDVNQKCVTSLQCTNYPIPQLTDCQFSLEICFNSQFNQCYFLNDVSGTGCSSQSLVQMYGVDMDGNCLQQYQMQAIKCSSGFCIINNYCQKYNNEYVGRDQNYRCLIEEQITAVECENQYCIMNIGTDSAYCTKVDQYNNVIGIYKSNLQQCITIDSPNQPASTCAYGQYCKDPVTQFCIQMQPGICQYYDTTCIIVNNNPLNLPCYQCDPSSCLNQYNQCIQISIENQFCVNQYGYCQFYKLKNCKSCPDQTCKNNSQQTCVEMINLQLLSNQCIIKQRPDVPCLIVDTNQYLNQILTNPSYSIQCTNTLRMCQNISNSSQFCYSCPINFIQPGNGKCYSLEEQQEVQYKSNSFYSFLNIIYISESFGVEDSQQCPQNCFSCQSKNVCTKCSFNYYLIEINPQKIICISIKNFQSIEYKLDYNESQFYQQNRLFLQCTQDGINKGFIQDIYSFPLSVKQVQYYDYISIRLLFQTSLIDCQNFIQFELNTDNQIVSLEFLKQINIYYQISQSTVLTDKFFQYFQDIQCDSQCNQCFYNQISQQHQCLKCNQGFSLHYSGRCFQCPKNCLDCVFGGFYNQQNINWSEIQNLYSSQFLSQLSSEEYSLRCTQCQQGFTVQSTYQGCDPCGQNCKLCYTGMPNYNHSNQLNFDPNFLSVATLIYKCIECLNTSYKFFDDVNCQQTTIQNCQIEYNVVQTDFPYILNSNSWKLNNNVAPYCYQCTQTYFNVQNQLCLRSRDTCFNQMTQYYNQCVSNSVNINLNVFTSKCQSLLFQDTYNSNPIFCYQCNQDTNQQIYQCTKCEDNYVVTLQGCLPCPTGCVECFYSDGIINYSDQFTFNQPFYSLKFRQNLINDNKAYLFCTYCQDGYYYKDYKCIQLQCDQTCQSCQLYKNQIFKCLQCNQQYLMSYVTNIIGYISLFHLLNGNSVVDINSMVNFDQNHSACHMCPYPCQACEKVGETKDNPFNIYSSLCKKCKDNLPIPQITPESERSNYKWVYDSERQKCLLCLNSDQGCTYQTVKRQIYAVCGSNSDSIGEGTIGNPLNIQRSSEINWDKLIINQQDLTKYLVFYNEISVEFIDVELIINQNDCRLFQKIQIKTSISQYIFGLQRFSLTITNKAQSQTTLESSQPIQISGFTHVTFQSLSLLTSSQNSYFILKSKDVVYCSQYQSHKQFQGLLIQSSSFLNRSIFFNIQSNQANKRTYSNWNDVSIQNNEIGQNSQIISYSYFVINQINNLTLQFNNFTCQQQYSLFQQNLLQLSQLIINNNTFINYTLFEVYQQPKIVYTDQFNFFLSDITVQQNLISSSSGLLFKLIGNSKTLVDQIKINLLNVKADNIFLTSFNSVLINIQYAISFTLSKFTVNNSYFSKILTLRNTQSLFLSDGVVTGNQALQCDQFIINNINQILEISKLSIINTLSIATIFKITNTDAQNQSLIIKIHDLKAENNKFIVRNIINNVGMFIINNIEQVTFQKGKLTIENINFTDNQTELTTPSLYLIFLDIYITNAQFLTQQPQLPNYDLQGGFAYIQADSIQIIDSSFSGQKAINGGALYICLTGLGQLLIRKSSFQSNEAFINNQNSMGGAIYIQTNLANYLDITVENSSFQNNFAIQGAVFYIEKTNVSIFANFNYVNFEDNFSLLQSIILYINGIDYQKIMIILQNCQVFNTIQNMNKQIVQMQATLSSTFLKNNEYYYIYINQGEQVTITNLQFQQTFSFLDYNLISQQISLPIPIQVINTQSYLNTFSQYLMTTTDYELIHIEANKIALESVRLFQIESLLEKQQLIKFKANSINITNTVLDSLSCSGCAYGNLNLEISGAAYIQNSFFKNNICQNGGGIYLQSSIPIQSLTSRLLSNEYNPIKIVQMFQNAFQNNTSLGNGGAIYAKNVEMIIQNTKINDNIANSLGGGIYNDLQISLLTDQILINQYQLFNINLQNTYIIQNIAHYGGGGYYSYFNLPQTQNNFILGNKAYQFGSDVASFPTSYQVYYNNILVKQNDTVIIPSSGQVKGFFTVFLMSSNKNQIYKTMSSDNITLYVSIINSDQNSNYILRSNKITFKDNLFDLSDLEIYGKFSQKFRISLYCDQVKQAIYNEQGTISQILKNITFQFEIQITNECQVGYKSNQINNTYDSCVACQYQTYSIKPGQFICQKCYSNQFQCQLSNIGLPDGYYRLNNNTDVIEYCSDWPQNCVGDISRDSSLLNTQRSGNWNIYYCEEGNTGVFCLDCDYLGKYWNKSYMKYQQYSCQECNSQNIMLSILVAIKQQLKNSNFQNFYLLFSIAFFDNITAATDPLAIYIYTYFSIKIK